MYKNFPNEQEKKKIFFDNPKVFLKGRYIQPKGKSIGKKISHRVEKAGKIGGDIGYCEKLSIREKLSFCQLFLVWYSFSYRNIQKTKID